jgi:DNA-binding response OmpR family regulator
VPSTDAATILVLEENPAVQELIDQALRECGYRVLSTKDGLEAVGVVRRVRIDLLVAGAPFGERRQLVLAELRSLQPGLPIVSISASGDDIRNVDGSGSLPNPFSLDDLQAAVVAGLTRQEGRSEL